MEQISHRNKNSIACGSLVHEWYELANALSIDLEQTSHELFKEYKSIQDAGKSKKQLMENFSLDRDIKIMCVTSKPFPGAVLAIHQRLHSILPSKDDRNFYGISRHNKGKIIYKAAAQEIKNDEADKLGLEEFVFRKATTVAWLSIFTRMTSRLSARHLRNFCSIRKFLTPTGCALTGYFNEKT